MIDELVAWLRVQIDEDERLANLAAPGPWHLNAEGDEVVAADGIEVVVFALSSNQLRNTAEHIARHDPPRILAEVAAKRAILKLHDVAWIRPGHPHFNDTHLTSRSMAISCSCEPVRQFRREQSWPCPTLRTLALPYVARPGFQERWRP